MAGQIEWAMWANETAFQSCLFLLMGAIIGVAGDFVNWQFSACVIVECVVLFILEYPRSKRVKGSTKERRWQLPLTKFLARLRPVSSNYYFRFVLLLLFSIPCCFLLPTIMGGLGWMMAAIIYLAAAIKGEEWKPVNLPSRDPEPTTQGPSIPQPPVRPPPRLTPNSSRENLAYRADFEETGFNRV